MLVLALVAFLALPLATILAKSLQDADGAVRRPGQLHHLREDAGAAAVVCQQRLGLGAGDACSRVPLAFGFAYALTRSCIPRQGRVPHHRADPAARAVAAVGAVADLLVRQPGHRQGRGHRLGFENIYGAPGIVIAECFAVFPHALMILVTALALADARLYEAARGARHLDAARKFFTITLPGAKYGLISAALVTFTLVITDFGIPKVIGGNFNVLATDVFKLVIGQQDFQRGAVVGLLLLAPAVLTFGVDWLVRRKQTAMLTARAVPYSPKPANGFDAADVRLSRALISALMLAMLGMAVFASFAKLLALQPDAEPAPLHAWAWSTPRSGAPSSTA